MHSLKEAGKDGDKDSDKPPTPRTVFVHGPQHPVLDRALAGSRWRGGGHKKALLMLDDVLVSPIPVRVGGSKVRGIFIPQKYLPKKGN